jgi:hypothetical protein
MITDPLWYRLFKISPETFFLLFGMSIEEAQRIAASDRFEALQFKETAYRSDGWSSACRGGIRTSRSSSVCWMGCAVEVGSHEAGVRMLRSPKASRATLQKPEATTFIRQSGLTHSLRKK